MSVLPFGKPKPTDAQMVKQFYARQAQAFEVSGEPTARAALRMAHYELTFCYARLDEAQTIPERSAATIAILRAKLKIAEAEYALAVAKEATERYMKAAR
jgi:hypothetical protein